MFIKLKKLILFTLIVGFIIIISEGLNYLHNPNSPISLALNTHFIKKAILYAESNNFDKSVYNLSIASNINIFGEFDPYRNLLPNDYAKTVSFPDDTNFKTTILNYIAGLKPEDLREPEDQGLGRIYYNLAVIAGSNGYPDLTPKLLKLAIYNNPEFASFHAELINYYYGLDEMDEVNKEMGYCMNFENAKTLCNEYRDDSIKKEIAHYPGYLKKDVDKHYLRME